MGEIEDKYNICYIDRRRYYIEDLSKRNFNVECATPYYFNYKDIRIYESSWKNMVYKIALQMNLQFPKSDMEYLELKNDWGKQKVFSEEKLKNYERFNNLYINLNHTAVHALWTIQLLINFYGINPAECRLFLRRHGSAEPKEAQAYFQQKTIDELNLYMQEKCLYPEDRCKRVIKNLMYLNKFMPDISKSHNNLFLFDDGANFANYKDKLLEYLKFKKRFEEDKLKIAESCLKVIYKYYYATYNSPNDDVF